jgi:uncharacterized protein YjdB
VPYRPAGPASGEEAQLAAEVFPPDASNKTLTWQSSAPGVADVDGRTVSGKAPGTAVIVVTTQDGGYTATCTVTVAIPVTDVKLSLPDLTVLEGESKHLTAVVEPEGADPAVT